MKPFDIIGYIGIASFSLATIPTITSILNGNTTNLPHWSLVLFVWIGLLCFFIRSVQIKDKLFSFANGLIFILQSILGILITIN